jgi:two-component SAPR family response regulator
MTKPDVSGEQMTGRRLEVKMLGTSEVRVQGVPAAGLRAGKTRKLFQYLAMRRGRVIPKSQLVDVLWPEGSSGGGNASLKVAVHALRRVLRECEKQAGVPVAEVRYVDFGYELVTEDVCVDVTEFSTLAQAAAAAAEAGDVELAKATYTEAAALYHGPFLPDDESEWAREERMWAESLYVKILNGLIMIAVSEGRELAAIDLCKRVVSLDPYNEEMYRLMMEMHGNSSELGMALRWYSECEDRLRNGLGVEPSDETRESLVRVLALCGVEYSPSWDKQFRLGERLAQRRRAAGGEPLAG